MRNRKARLGHPEKGPAAGRNRILNALDPEAAERLRAELNRITLDLGAPLLDPGKPIENLFFPDTAMASAMGVTLEGATAEIGLIGWEGVSGVSVLLGAEVQTNIVNVQMPGDFLVLPAETAREEFARGGSFQKLTLLFVHEAMMQISQTAVCNVVHGLEQRLARWLLMCHDRSCDEKLRLTQEFLAMMVGVSRQSLSGAARLLQDLGYIKYSRGVIDIINREALERFACHCYQVVKLERDGTMEEARPDGGRANA